MASLFNFCPRRISPPNPKMLPTGLGLYCTLFNAQFASFNIAVSFVLENKDTACSVSNADVWCGVSSVFVFLPICQNSSSPLIIIELVQLAECYRFIHNKEWFIGLLVLLSICKTIIHKPTNFSTMLNSITDQL